MDGFLHSASAAVSLGCALVAALGMIALLVRQKRNGAVRLVAALRAADTLRDEVWRLEANSAARERAEAASEAKGRFLATVSHEIRTPLAGMLGTAELLAAMPLDEEATSYVGALRACGTALSSLIDEILDFSRIEAGRLEIADVEFAMPPLVESVVELLAPRAHAQGLSVASVVASSAPPRMRGDPARLRQILLNLVGNAIKFTNAGGVGLRVWRDSEGTVRFTVSDTGCGVPYGQRHAIFDEFGQGDVALTRTKGGAGLGLAISRALAHRMGGALTLDASSADGSTFTLALPSAAPVGAVISPRPSAKRVLLFAPAPFEGDFLRERLGAFGASVLHAATEEDAAVAFACATSPEDCFHLAIIDCAAGEVTAQRIAGLAHEAGVARVVVLLSPTERREISEEGWRAFDGWLVKPVRDASLRFCLDPPTTGRADATKIGAQSHRLDGRRILVAEDDPVNALIATRLLERQGAQVLHVEDGAAALDAIATASVPFDAALMDIRMPRLDGLAVARRIRESGTSDHLGPLPLVALSANAFEEDRQAALAAGFDAFLVKPVALDVLADTLAGVMARRKKREAA